MYLGTGVVTSAVLDDYAALRDLKKICTCIYICMHMHVMIW